MSMGRWVTAADIGGTHITVCKVDINTGNLDQTTLVRHAIHTVSDAADIIQSWGNAIKECHHLAEAKDNVIGIAIPGPFDYDLGVSKIRGLGKYEALYNLPVKQLLADELNTNPVNILMTNDAMAYMKGECFRGAAKDHDDILGLIFGTGLGSALYRNNILKEENLFSYPLNEATAEDYLSTRWFQKEWVQHTGQNIDGVKTLAEMHESAKVSQLFQQFGDNIAILIQRKYKVLPKAILLGGNIARSAPLFMPALQNQLPETCKVMTAALGEVAPLMGAAFLWK